MISKTLAQSYAFRGFVSGWCDLLLFVGGNYRIGVEKKKVEIEPSEDQITDQARYSVKQKKRNNNNDQEQLATQVS